RHPRGAGAEEEALDLGIARLDQAAPGRGHPARGVAHPRSEKADPAFAWRAAQKRTGRAFVRAPRLPEPAGEGMSEMRGDLKAQEEGAAETNELFEMANLYPRTTGLSMTVWVSPRGNARHDVRIKVNMTHGNQMTVDNTAVVAV